MPSSRGSSPPRDQTQGSCIAGGFWAIWATKEAHHICILILKLIKLYTLNMYRFFLTSHLNNFSLLIFSWRIIALQYYVGVCHTSTRISHRYTYVPPSWNSLSTSHPSQPSRWSQSPGLSSLSHTTNSHWLSVWHMVVYMFLCSSLHSSHPLLPTYHHRVHSLFSMSASPLRPCK